jgi:hypothetical protein
MDSEPALNEEHNCMVLVLGNMTGGGGAALHAKLDKCDKAIHNFVCITYPCRNQDVECWGHNTKPYKWKGQGHGAQLPPKLEIR